MTESKIEVLLYGLGAIGSFYAFILQRSARVRLSVVARSNYDAVKADGILMRSENHGEHRFRPAAVYRHPREATEEGVVFDFVVCANKAVGLERTARDLVGVVKEGNGEGMGGTTIVLMQNGVGNEDAFHDVFPRCTILSGVIWVGATQDSPGVVRQHINESTTIGIFSATDFPIAQQQASLDLFCGLLFEGKTPYVVDPSIQTPKWKKCIWNAAWNSLTTLSGADTHTWLESSTFAMDTTKRLMNEAIQVAKAVGVPGIENSLGDELIKKMQGLPGPVWTSMYHDSRAERAMEVEVILGSIVRKGKECGVQVPTLETLYALLLAVDQGIQKGKENGEEVR